MLLFIQVLVIVSLWFDGTLAQNVNCNAVGAVVAALEIVSKVDTFHTSFLKSRKFRLFRRARNHD
jgi:hypothetical protein